MVVEFSGSDWLLNSLVVASGMPQAVIPLQFQVSVGRLRTIAGAAIIVHPQSGSLDCLDHPVIWSELRHTLGQASLTVERRRH